MASFNKITIEGEEIYIKNLNTIGGGYSDDGVIKDIIESSSTVQAALTPIINLGKKIKAELKNLEPDETELTIQLAVGLDEDKLFFALADVSAEAQVSIKWSWKKSES